MVTWVNYQRLLCEICPPGYPIQDRPDCRAASGQN